MCEFISWIEKEGEVLFLTAKDIDSEHGKKTLESSLNNDFLGHGAIRRFYGPDGKSLSGGTNRENRAFWDGNLPQKIKDAWNNGELDGMMRYLQGDDLEYIVNWAPAKFVDWTMTQRYGKDYEAMKKDDNPRIRLMRMMATQNYEAMKKDSNWMVRLAGMVATQDYEAMKRDDNPRIRLMGMIATQDYEAMKKDDHTENRQIGLVATQDYEAMKKDHDQEIRLTGMIATRDYKAMKKEGSWAYWLLRGYADALSLTVKKDGYNWSWVEKLIRLTTTQDYEAMKKDDAVVINRIGLVVTQDYEAMKKNGFWKNRRIGLVATRDYEAMKKDDNPEIQLMGIIATQDYEAMKKNNKGDVWLVGMTAAGDYKVLKKASSLRLLGIAVTYEPEKLVRPRL